VYFVHIVGNVTAGLAWYKHLHCGVKNTKETKHRGFSPQANYKKKVYLRNKKLLKIQEQKWALQVGKHIFTSMYFVFRTNHTRLHITPRSEKL
jgi:hypothetical protein